MEIDFLIIGQGLAGSLLAWELIGRNQRIIVIDNAIENASQIAAGLINPVTGMRLVKSTGVDQSLPTAIQYYQQLSDYFQKSFYIEKSMLRILRNDKELKTAKKRLLQLEYQAYLETITSTLPNLKLTNGILKQKKTGYLLTQPLLKALKEFLIKSNSYIQTEFDYDEISLAPSITWNNIKPKHIVFCEGHRAINNPWFSWLPFQLVKGEIITATSEQPLIDCLLNYGHWYIPLKTNQFRTGATFDRNSLQTQPTNRAKEELLTSLYQHYPKIKIQQIINHKAGIRPTTLDKNPFVGTHPHHSRLIIFNGFGSKGSLMIPTYCQALTNNLLHNKPLPKLGNIDRYRHIITHNNSNQ